MSAVLLGLVAAPAWGMHDFLVRFVSKAVGGLQSVLTVLVAGAIALSIGMHFMGVPLSIPEAHGGTILLSGIAYAMALVALYRAFAIGPNFSRTVLLAMVLLRERVTPPQGIGMLGILAGVMVLSMQY